MLITACSYLLAYVFYGQEKTVTGEVVFAVLQLGAHVGLTVGTMLFFRLKFNENFYFLIFAITAVTVCLLHNNGLKLLADLSFVTFLSGSMLYVAFRLLKLPIKNQSIKCVIALYALMGVHWLNYPLLGAVEWFAPIGFLVGMILGVFLGLSLAVLALLQFEKQTKESEQRAKASEQKAIYAATHDTLTGLYNRSHLDKLFNLYAKEAEDNQHSFTMFYLDLDGFKAVNDTYGHKAGDFLLQTIARRLINLLNERGDVIRIGGDEIVALSNLRNKYDTDYVCNLARKVLSTIEQPIVHGNQTYHVSASIGVCCYPHHGEDLEKLLEKADALMYEAKKAGRKQIRFADFPERKERNMPELLLTPA